MIEHKTHAYLIVGADEHDRRDYAGKVIREFADNNSNVSTTYIESESSVTLDIIKSVLTDISLTAFNDSLRSIVICEAHTMTSEAGNALLKALEEPPKGVFFILLTPTVAQIMPTLRSRSRIISLNQYEQSENQVAINFFRMSIPKRLGVIAGIPDRFEQFGLARDLLSRAQKLRYFDFAQWLSEHYMAAEKSGNGRLLLESCALHLEESLDV